MDNVIVTMHFWGPYVSKCETTTAVFSNGKEGAVVIGSGNSVIVDRDGARRLKDLFEELYYKLAPFEEKSSNANV